MAKFWAEKLRTRTGNIQCVEIELLSGKYVYVDEQIFNQYKFRTQKIEEDANDYWSGDETISDPIIAILFEGKFKVCQERTL